MNENEFARQVGQRLRMRRKRLGLSQELLAAKAGCDISTIGRIERAEKSPTVDMLFRIADPLQTTVRDLVDCMAPAAPAGWAEKLEHKVTELVDRNSRRELEAATLMMDGLISYGRTRRRRPRKGPGPEAAPSPK